MNEVPSELELMAYADGELDAAAAERVRRYLDGNPDALAKVRTHEKLCEAGRRCLGDAPVPMGLIGRIKEIKGETRRTSSAGFGGGWRIGWITSVAAVLVIGLGSVVLWSNRGGGQDVVRQSELLPVNWVRSASRVHSTCSKHADHFAASFP